MFNPSDPAKTDRTKLDLPQMQRWIAARHFSDQQPVAVIAMELGVPESTVDRLIDDELCVGKRPGHTKRTHVVTDRRQAECPRGHGAFEQVLWSLDPMPVPQIGRPMPAFLAPFWSACPTCDSALQAEADARDAETRDGRTMTKQLAEARLRAAGIPERFVDSTVWNWQRGMAGQRRAWDWARDYCTQFQDALAHGRCGVFAGDPGTGKTHLSIGVLKHILEKGGTGLYTTVMGMLSRIKDTYNRASVETELAVVRELKSVDLLVIDEVGKSLDTNYELAQFFRILDLRYGDLRPTILVTNLSVVELKKFLGDALVDRMREAGGQVLTFDWASYRNPKKNTEESS